MRFILQEWEPYEADLGVPLTNSDLSLKVSPPPLSYTVQQLHCGECVFVALLPAEVAFARSEREGAPR